VPTHLAASSPTIWSSCMPRNRNEELPQYAWPEHWDEDCRAFCELLARGLLELGSLPCDIPHQGWDLHDIPRGFDMWARMCRDNKESLWHTTPVQTAVANYMEHLLATESR
jgi:hypothetical protein